MAGQETAPAVSAPARLLNLLRAGELDWDDERHRAAFLRAWVNGDLPSLPLTEDGCGE